MMEIIFPIVLAMIFVIFVLIAKKKIQQVMAWQKRAIRKITVKKRYYFFYYAGILIFVLLFLAWRVGDRYIFNPKLVAALVMICFFVGIRIFVDLKYAQILVIDEGLVVSNNLVPWIDIDSVEDFKHSIVIFTKIKWRKKIRINKTFRGMNQTDVDLIKSLCGKVQGASIKSLRPKERYG